MKQYIDLIIVAVMLVAVAVIYHAGGKASEQRQDAATAKTVISITEKKDNARNIAPDAHALSGLVRKHLF